MDRMSRIGMRGKIEMLTRRGLLFCRGHGTSLVHPVYPVHLASSLSSFAALRVLCAFAVEFSILLAALGLARPGWAIFLNAGEPVPVQRLLENVGKYVAQNPKDARGHYTLGRIHSLAFARSMAEVRVVVKDAGTQTPLPLPGFAPYESILERRAESQAKPDAAALGHLGESVRHYGHATQLARKEALYWLGLGWMLEQGAPFAAEVDAPFLKPPKRVSAERWRQKAREAYRRAYNLAVDRDLRQESFGPAADASISLEAGEGILRLLPRGPLSRTHRLEANRVRETVRALHRKPRVVTPILFPLNGRDSLDTLVGTGPEVTFDLAGDGRPERWPWVGPGAGILVWDPEKKGRITSGRQLFGSFTWSMFWRDGYEPLAALDDDRDGWLAGRELNGLAVWQDRNGNAVSEPGEVLSLAEMDIERVAVRSAGRIAGTLCNPRGMQRRDGTYLPTYDWTPTSR
jgi:hypothetical protein